MRQTIGCDRSTECECDICRAFRKYENAGFNNHSRDFDKLNSEFVQRLNYEFTNELDAAKKEIIDEAFDLVSRKVSEKTGEIRKRFNLIVVEFLSNRND